MKKVIKIAKLGKYKKVRVEFVHMDLYPRNFKSNFKGYLKVNLFLHLLIPKPDANIYCILKITHLLLFVAGLVTVRARTF